MSKENIQLWLNDQTIVSNVKLSNIQFYTKTIEERVILKFTSLQEPNLETFQQFKNSLYQQAGANAPNLFENTINILMTPQTKTGNPSSFFAFIKNCPSKWTSSILPKGTYLYGYCSDQQLNTAIQNLLNDAKTEHGVDSPTIVQSIIFTGLFQWFIYIIKLGPQFLMPLYYHQFQSTENDI